MPTAANRSRVHPRAIRRVVRPSPMPATPAPMLATLAAKAFDHPDWIFEPKFDGLRVLVRFDGDRLLLISRNNKSQNFQFPEVVAALEKSFKRPCMLDGEIVCFDARGKTSFRALQQRFHLLDEAKVRERAAQF